MLDRYWHGATRRVSPEAPVPVVDVEHTEDCPGGAANVAVNVKSLGAGSTLLGCVGDDAPGHALKRKLDASGVCEDFIVSPDASTTLKLRVVSRQQQLLRTDFEKPTSASLARRLAMQVPGQLEHADALIVADYDKARSATRPCSSKQPGAPTSPWWWTPRRSPSAPTPAPPC